MPAWTERRLKSLIFVALLVVALVVLASLLYFRAGQRIPEGAEIVWDQRSRTGAGEPVSRPSWAT